MEVNPDYNRVAREKYRRAMALVEQAQRLIGDASAELCPVIWGNPDYQRLGKLYDKIHAEWYKLKHALDVRGPKLDLDETGRAAADRRAAAASAPVARTPEEAVVRIGELSLLARPKP